MSLSRARRPPRPRSFRRDIPHGRGAVSPRVEESRPEAYALCRRIHRRRDPTYYWATRRLPADVRPAVHALYAYVRIADDIVDAPAAAAPPEQRRRSLDAWQEALGSALDGAPPAHPVVAALVDAGDRHDLPLDGLESYMRSMRRDCGPVRVATWDELEEYMEGSAGSVGRIMAPLLGAPGSSGAAFARLGRGFQLANFLRDVPEDHALDRIYIPREDLDRFGTGEADIASRRPTPAFRALVAFELTRARSLLGSADEACRAVAPRVRPGMRLAASVYGAMLDRIESAGGDVLLRRPRPAPWHVGRAVWSRRRARARGTMRRPGARRRRRRARARTGRAAWPPAPRRPSSGAAAATAGA